LLLANLGHEFGGSGLGTLFEVLLLRGEVLVGLLQLGGFGLGIGDLLFEVGNLALHVRDLRLGFVRALGRGLGLRHRIQRFVVGGFELALQVRDFGLGVFELSWYGFVGHGEIWFGLIVRRLSPIPKLLTAT